MNVRLAIGTMALFFVSACAGPKSYVPMPPLTDNATARSPVQTGLPPHAIIGFSVDTPARVTIAAREDITTTILYDGSPAPRSALGKALNANGIDVIDGLVSGYLYYWECHRTHTVALPPSNYKTQSVLPYG